jgi:LmbE family N-acetylglucosaminyl deacetylase
MSVLVIAPHPDDESIGCGGAIALHAQRGARVVVAFLTSGELGLKHLPRDEAWRVREAEARAAADVLGVAELHFLRLPDWFVGEQLRAGAGALQPLLRAERPVLIYAPHAGEWHPDHKAAIPLLRAASAGAAIPAPQLRTYEVWTPLAEHDHVEDVTAVMAAKLRAVRCHVSQLTTYPYDRAVRGLNRYRGVIAGRCRYAEVFRSADLTASDQAGT